MRVVSERLRKLLVRSLIRDPRDVIVSGCFYHQSAEEAWLQVPQRRLGGLSYQEKLRSYASFDDQLLFEMENPGVHTIRQMLEWGYSNPLFWESSSGSRRTRFPERSGSSTRTASSPDAYGTRSTSALASPASGEPLQARARAEVPRSSSATPSSRSATSRTTAGPRRRERDLNEREPANEAAAPASVRLSRKDAAAACRVVSATELRQPHRPRVPHAGEVKRAGEPPLGRLLNKVPADDSPMYSADPIRRDPQKTPSVPSLRLSGELGRARPEPDAAGFGQAPAS
jgi:hypothetical protein